MTTFQVDSGELLAATGSAQGYMSRLEAEASGLTGLLVNLQSVWSGQAASAFQAAVADWRATEQRLGEALAALGQALNVAGTQYAEIEQANTRLFAG